MGTASQSTRRKKGTQRAVGNVTAGEYDIGLEVVIEPGSRVELVAYSFRHRGGKGIQDRTRRDLERQLPKVIDWFAATAVATRTERIDIAGGTLTLSLKGHDPVSTVLGEGSSFTKTFVDEEKANILLEDFVTRRRRREVTPELLAEVAEVYRGSNPRKPTESVAAYYGVSQATASRWIKAARDSGLLEPAPPRVGGRTSSKRKNTTKGTTTREQNPS
jgi:hypothetical protein